MNSFLKAGALALTILSFAGAADAAGVKSLFLGGDFSDNVTTAKTDIIGMDARFDQAGSAGYDYAANGSPTLAYLQQFDSVLFWANFAPNAGLGDLLADYVDSGGGVVISTFVGYYGASIGRLDDAGYNALSGGTTDAYHNVNLGVFNAADPLMQGVNTLQSTYYNGDYTTVRGGSTLAASWDNGRPLAAYNAAHNVANITLFPSVAYFGHASGDYRPLFANALVFTAGATGVSAAPEPASWAMMLIGFGGMGTLLRGSRRRRMVVA